MVATVVVAGAGSETGPVLGVRQRGWYRPLQVLESIRTDHWYGPCNVMYGDHDTWLAEITWVPAWTYGLAFILGFWFKGLHGMRV